MTILLEVGIAVLLLIVLASKSQSSDVTPPPAPAPSSPASSTFKDKFTKAVADAGGLQGLPLDAIYVQSHLECGGGTSNAFLQYNNGFGIHGEGSPNPYWDGRTYKTTNGEILRVYRTFADCLRDYLRLIQRKYPQAVQGAELGSVKAYFAGLVAGGYAGTPQTDFYNANYFQDLVARFKSVYGKDPS